MHEVIGKYTIYGKQGCTYCDLSKDLLQSYNIEFDYIPLDGNPEAVQAFKDKGFRTVPQVYYKGDMDKGKYVGGFEQMKVHIMENLL